MEEHFALLRRPEPDDDREKSKIETPACPGLQEIGLTLPKGFPSRELVNYAFRELARRAGASEGAEPDRNGFEELGVAFHYGVETPARPGAAAIVVVPAPLERWRELLDLPPDRLEWLPLEDALPPGGRVPFDGPLPILFRASGAEPGSKFAHRGSTGVVALSVDLVATVIFLLTRWEETVTPTKDAHGRMPAKAGVAARQGFLDRPLVDQYALILREWLRALRPGWTPIETPFRVRLSHDIDEVRPFPDLRSAAGTALRSLRDGDAPRAGRALAQTARQLAVPRSTDHARGIRRIASLSRRHGMASAFYVMAAERGPHDSGYDPGSGWVRDSLEELRREGFELGFHPGYRTFGDFSRLSEEKSRVERVLGGGSFGGRQHFLRFRAPDTWRDWERLGLTYDSTLAFADHEGFRCGTCHPYRPFDLEANREMRLSEIPLIVMDGTLRQYRGLTPEQGEERVRELATRCREVGGIFTLLWHNSSFHGAWEGWEPAYERMVAGLAAMQGHPPPGAASEMGN